MREITMNEHKIAHVTPMPAGWRAVVAFIHVFVTGEFAVEMITTPIVAINTYADDTQRFAYLAATTSDARHTTLDIHDASLFSNSSHCKVAVERPVRVLPPGVEYTTEQRLYDKDDAMMFLESRYRIDGETVLWHSSNVDYERR